MEFIKLEIENNIETNYNNSNLNLDTSLNSLSISNLDTKSSESLDLGLGLGLELTNNLDFMINYEIYEKNLIEQLMLRTCELAYKGIEKNCGPFACIITDGSFNIITENNNNVVSNIDPTSHAEINSIREACKILNNFNLQDYKLFSSCEPCPMCLGAIYWSGIKEVYYGASKINSHKYGFSDKFIYDDIKKSKKNRKIKMEQIKTDNIIKSFKEWEKKKDKILY